MIKSFLVINEKYKLSEEEKSIIDTFRGSNDDFKVNIKYISSEGLTTPQLRDKFESIFNDKEEDDEIVIFLLNIFHITIDIRYLLKLSSTIYVLKNTIYDISAYFYNKIPYSNILIEYYIIDSDCIESKINDLNKFLKKTVQAIGRKNRNKKKHFGRPLGYKGKSQYDRDKDMIRYRLNKKISPTKIHRELGYGSITALKYYIKTRFRKKYLI